MRCYVIYFSLAKNTDISVEIYPYHKLLIMADGSMEVYGSGYQQCLGKGEAMLTPVDTTAGIKTAEWAIYAEITIGRNDNMNGSIKAGENFCFAKGGLHSVKPTHRFKVALLLTLE